MKQILRSLTAIATILVGAAVTMAQYKCADYHRFNGDPSNDKRFSMNGQSKSAMVQVGKETELNIIVYKGQDYRISVSHDEKVLGEQLAIRLVEKVRVPYDELVEVTKMEPVLDAAGKATGTTQEVKTKQNKRVYEEEEKVLWDNTAHEMIDEVEFSCTATKRIAVEVNARGNSEAKPKKNGETNDIGCVGILIEHMPTPPLGF
ncbi:MAG: hypothetical protein JNL43_16015 [Flavobacteriales bacterium]|nr:hypothetical protein [Flavobacteriales bacterium]HRH68949.1 hypothetical protein [Flavobacteriales bacterium]